eukprot:3948777-Pyramimonas_sp.AAC.1
MTTAKGSDETDRQGIADVFADFYEKLYRRPESTNLPTPNSSPDAQEESAKRPRQSIPPFTYE